MGRYEYEVTLLRGRCCLTSKCRRKSDKTCVVVKEVTTNQMVNQKTMPAAMSEARTLSKLSHPQLTKLLEVKCDLSSSKWLFITEYCNGGSLRRKITTMQAAKQRLTERQILEWFFDVASAINYLHNNGIVHGSLNCQNILFDNMSSATTVKISDCGMASLKEKFQILSDSSEDALALWCYRAPETFRNQREFKSDCWSLGILLFELAMFDLPYHAFDQNEMALKMKNPPIKKLPSSFSKEYCRLVSELIQFQISRRPSSRDILCDEALQQLVLSQFDNLKVLLSKEIGEENHVCHLTEDLSLSKLSDCGEPGNLDIEPKSVNSSKAPGTSASQLNNFVTRRLKQSGSAENWKN